MQTPDASSVPVRLGLSKVAQFETQVTKDDAGKMGHAFLGRDTGAAACSRGAMLGINFSRRSVGHRQAGPVPARGIGHRAVKGEQS